MAQGALGIADGREVRSRARLAREIPRCLYRIHHLTRVYTSEFLRVQNRCADDGRLPVGGLRQGRALRQYAGAEEA